MDLVDISVCTAHAVCSILPVSGLSVICSVLFWTLNPFMPNGTSHCFQLDQSGLLDGSFHFFLQILKDHFVCKQCIP